MSKTKLKNRIFRFTDDEKHQIIQEVLSSGSTKRSIWKKYTGRDQEHGMILAWMRQFGYNSSISLSRSGYDTNFEQMTKRMAKTDSITDQENFENLRLKKRIDELEKQLKDAELKAIAFSTMIDIAEKELKIPIRKKYNTKP